MMDERERAIYVISVAAELAGVHPQTLRIYERKGLVSPHRTAGNTRRYSESDIELLRRIQTLTNEGINLAGVMRILELEARIERMRAENARTEQAASLVPLRDVRRVRRAMKSDAIDASGGRRIFAAGPIEDEEG